MTPTEGKNAATGQKTEKNRKGISTLKSNTMEIVLKRQKQSSSGEETIGMLYIDGIFQCLILEDQKRDVKVKGDTRIPAGRYKILLRKEGRIHQNYAEKFGKWHRGTLHLQDVPNFQYILIHIGNTEKDTEGCLLTNTGYNEKDGHFVGYGSTAAYQKIYPVIADAIEKNDVFIEIADES